VCWPARDFTLGDVESNNPFRFLVHMHERVYCSACVVGRQVNVVEAFDQSLCNMSRRLQRLTVSSNLKVCTPTHTRITLGVMTSRCIAVSELF